MHNLVKLNIPVKDTKISPPFTVIYLKNLLRIPYTDIKNIESILDIYLTTDNHVTIEYSSIRLYTGMIIETFKELM